MARIGWVFLVVLFLYKPDWATAQLQFQSPEPDGINVGSFFDFIDKKEIKKDLNRVRIRLFPILETPGGESFPVTGVKTSIELFNEKGIQVFAKNSNQEAFLASELQVSFADSTKVVLSANGKTYVFLENQTPLRLRVDDTTSTRMLWDKGLSTQVDILYRGHFEIAPTTFEVKKTGGKFSCNYKEGQFEVQKYWSVINEVSLETYLNSVVPSEVYTNWPLESLRAQAVAARTYSVRKMQIAREIKKYNWDMDPTTCFQSYKGAKTENVATTEGVVGTVGKILMYNDQVIEAMYSAHSGGYVCSHFDCFGENRDYLQSFADIEGVNDPGLVGTVGSSSGFRVHKLNLLSLANFLNQNGYSFDPEKEIMVDGERSPSKRMKELRVKDLASGQERILGQKPEDRANLLQVFRKNFGIKTSFFYFKEIEGDSQLAHGYGFGHGVGMSQWGAFLHAKKGAGFESILKFYYKETSLVSLPN